MSLAEKFLLGINTTVIGMGIVFIVLIGLQLILMLQTKVLGILFKKQEEAPVEKTNPQMQNTVVSNPVSTVEKKGLTSGEVIIKGVDDEETMALIMSVVSNAADIPLSQLRFISIKAI